MTRKTKANKFTCKLCGAVQSVKRIHGRSAQASDVRAVVSQLNALRHQCAPDTVVPTHDDGADGDTAAPEPPPVSRYGWAAFLEAEDRAAKPREESAPDPGYVTALPERMPAAGSKRGRRAAEEDEEEREDDEKNHARPAAAVHRAGGAAGGQPRGAGRAAWGTFLVDE